MSDHLQQAADREDGGGSSSNSLLRIVGLVFLVAFVLLVFSFLMEHRLDELHESVSSLQTVEEERQALRQEVNALRTENEELKSQYNDAAKENDALKTQLTALELQLEDALHQLQEQQQEEN